jgi:segregation and condensation protein B
MAEEENEEQNKANQLRNEKVVEAALFISARFMSTKELVAITGINPITLKETLATIHGKYSDNSAFTLINNGDNYKLDILPEYHGMINKLASGDSEFTKAEQETLAIVAYKQPITQSVIVKIRGNKAYDHVKKFLEIGMLKSKRVGHTLQLTLNENFYDYFNLRRTESSSDAQKSDISDMKKEN